MPLEGKSTPPENADKRIFLRLPQEHQWRNLSPAGIREIVVKKLAISPASIGRIKPGLERVIAKRISYLAITSDVVGQQQFGALPKRSANDLVSCVVHDIEEARCQGWASTLVTLDIQGAFDSVLHNRLLWRMQAQGWPDMILQWTRSFLMNRSVQVRYPGGVTSPKGLVCGVPQGSPISPLLSLLYMAEPMRSGTSRARFSYADDFRILGNGCTIAESLLAKASESCNYSSIQGSHCIAMWECISRKTGFLDNIRFASVRDEVPIRQMAWTRRSKESPEPLGHIRIHVRETKANKFPSRLQLFGAVVGIQRIREHKPVTTC
ncbi:hypothetical protein EPUL_002906 [Erysiphe pulchra]|uniref:Reverse transcriptase domain-containing protein n=1 Tax=Erysiphe pulchra TaxID=225359 RepID=A0A2S4PRA5_9PEZI|nr:hypothetical protein EPUL_002906 [Erysiphe pulchra]